MDLPVQKSGDGQGFVHILLAHMLFVEACEDSADAVADGHEEQVKNRFYGKDSGVGEVEHIGHTVLVARKNEDRDGQYEDEITSGVGNFFVAVYRDEHENSAENRQHEYA